MLLPVSFATLECVPAEILLAATLLTEASNNNATHKETGEVDESFIVPSIRVESLTELLGSARCGQSASKTVRYM